MIYLASPYTTEDYLTKTRRYLAAREFCWHHMELGVKIFSPIVYGHSFHTDFGAPASHEYWQALNESLILLASEIWVLQLPGWQDSAGVAAEISFAWLHSIPVSYVEPLPHTRY